MIKLYTLSECLPESMLSGLFSATQSFRLVAKPEEADFFAFPTNYEVPFEYSSAELTIWGISSETCALLKRYFKALIELSAAHRKKIIVFYYRDPIAELPVPNAIVFRTSILKSLNRPNEYAMPAFKEDLSAKCTEEMPAYLAWSPTPTVGFRGQAAPMKLTPLGSVRNGVNLCFNRWGMAAPLKMFFNYGYVHRRNAMYFLKKSKKVSTDFTITRERDITDHNAKAAFLANIFNNAYNLCVSGHGNYSYRLYEVMSAGRIPIFINTDCKLPFEEFEDWKSYVVWVESKDIWRLEEILLAFHHKHPGDKFLDLQKKIRLFWETHLREDGFFNQIAAYLPAQAEKVSAV